MGHNTTIIHLASEVAPFYKRGGLGDVVGSLPKYLREAGDNAVISFYYHPNMKGLDTAEPLHLELAVHGIRYPFTVYHLTVQNVAHYFINLSDTHAFGETEDAGTPNKDQDGQSAYQMGLPPSLFLYFAKAALTLIETLGWRPAFLLAHDWHTCGIFAYPERLRSLQLETGLKTLLLIHNFEFQGDILPDAFRFLDPEGANALQSMYQRHKRASFLGLGILSADHVATVSPSYAEELTAHRAPHSNLCWFSKRHLPLLSFQNGADVDRWSPERSPYLEQPFHAKDRVAKNRYKQALLKTCGLSAKEPNRPVVLLLARLTQQKGIHLLLDFDRDDTFALNQLENLLATGIYLVVLGKPADGFQGRVHQLLSKANEQFKGQFYYNWDYSDHKAHHFLAGADVLLAPSLFEPCGLVQLYAMAFAAVPIVRPVGGLRDTVQCYFRHPQTATGFHIEHHTADSLRQTVAKAIKLYHEQPQIWQHLIDRGQEQDFSWARMARAYTAFFEAQKTKLPPVALATWEADHDLGYSPSLETTNH